MHIFATVETTEGWRGRRTRLSFRGTHYCELQYLFRSQLDLHTRQQATLRFSTLLWGQVMNAHQNYLFEEKERQHRCQTQSDGQHSKLTFFPVDIARSVHLSVAMKQGPCTHVRAGTTEERAGRLLDY